MDDRQNPSLPVTAVLVSSPRMRVRGPASQRITASFQISGICRRPGTRARIACAGDYVPWQFGWHTTHHIIATHDIAIIVTVRVIAGKRVRVGVLVAEVALPRFLYSQDEFRSVNHGA